MSLYHCLMRRRRGETEDHAPGCVVPVSEELNAELPRHPQISGAIPGGLLGGGAGNFVTVDVEGQLPDLLLACEGYRSFAA